MKLITPVFLFICLFLYSISAFPQASLDYSKQAQIQKILNNWRSRTGIPSATLSILLPNQEHPVTFASGTTAYMSGQRTTHETLFQAGSITKSFTSTIILQLESEGKLNINEPITKYLPQYSWWSNITIRQLLNHTSGIYNYTTAPEFNNIRKYNPQAEFTPDEIVRIASQHRNYFYPGHGWKYSNTNYVLAGMIIEKVSGQPVDSIMNRWLHGARVNLSNTYYLARVYTKDFISHMAHGYSSDGRDVTSHNMSWAGSAGAIVTTSEDLLRWWRGLFHGQILPPEEMAKMTSLVCTRSSHYCPPGTSMSHLSDTSKGKGYGLGVIQSATGSKKIGTVWWHNGSTKGYKAIVMWYPKTNIYMALTIDRDPGYLLKPSLPTIRRVLNVLISDKQTVVSHRRRYKIWYS